MQPQRNNEDDRGDQMRFGPGGEIWVRSLGVTPYLVAFDDSSKRPIVAIAVGRNGYVLHPARDVTIGPPLEEKPEPSEVRR